MYLNFSLYYSRDSFNSMDMPSYDSMESSGGYGSQGGTSGGYGGDASQNSSGGGY